MSKRRAISDIDKPGRSSREAASKGSYLNIPESSENVKTANAKLLIKALFSGMLKNLIAKKHPYYDEPLFLLYPDPIENPLDITTYIKQPNAVHKEYLDTIIDNKVLILDDEEFGKMQLNNVIYVTDSSSGPILEFFFNSFALNNIFCALALRVALQKLWITLQEPSRMD
jgi:hypothetical protein